MDASTPEGRLVLTLKPELKVKGVHYREIASRLQVHEATVLRKLAETVDLDLRSLAELAENYEGEQTFTKAQQTALAKDRVASCVFFLLWQGCTPAQIKAEFGIAGLDAAIAKLESIGVVRRQARGIKIRATPRMDERGGGQLADLNHDLARLFLPEVDLKNRECEWAFYFVRLSRASQERLISMKNKFIEEARVLTLGDAALPMQATRWYRVFVGAEPISRKKFFQQH